MNAEPTDLVYLPERDQSFTDDRCFLCGADLREVEQTDEHVFPQWLLRDHDLWRERIHLLNGTTIPYAQLTIPCCHECNTTHLSRIEESVSKAWRTGHEAVAALDENLLFLWMAKIYYGLLFRELFLPLDRTNPSQGQIMDPELLEEYQMHHLLLQGARGVVHWEGALPASIYVFECQVSEQDPRANFDYADHLLRPFLAIRAGRVAVIATLQDWGALGGAVTLEPFEAARQMSLHPAQFRALVATGQYMNSLFNRTPKHLVHWAEESVKVITLPLGGLSGRPLFDDWDTDTYAKILANALGQPVESIWDGVQITDILGSSDAPREIPWDGGPLPVVSHLDGEQLRAIGVEVDRAP